MPNINKKFYVVRVPGRAIKTFNVQSSAIKYARSKKGSVVMKIANMRVDRVVYVNK